MLKDVKGDVFLSQSPAAAHPPEHMKFSCLPAGMHFLLDLFLGYGLQIRPGSDEGIFSPKSEPVWRKRLCQVSQAENVSCLPNVGYFTAWITGVIVIHGADSQFKSLGVPPGSKMVCRAHWQETVGNPSTSLNCNMPFMDWPKLNLSNSYSMSPVWAVSGTKKYPRKLSILSVRVHVSFASDSFDSWDPA